MWWPRKRLASWYDIWKNFQFLSSCFLQTTVWKKIAKAVWWGKYFLCTEAILIANINQWQMLSLPSVYLSFSLFSYHLQSIFLYVHTYTYIVEEPTIHYLQDVSLTTYHSVLLDDCKQDSNTAQVELPAEALGWKLKGGEKKRLDIWQSPTSTQPESVITSLKFLGPLHLDADWVKMFCLFLSFPRGSVIFRLVYIYFKLEL